jgi:alpha-tubulin suppressor-like RCC1 family protein
MVEALSMWEAKTISCSENSTFCLMESGELFSWGSGEHGILGIGDIFEN